MTLEKHEQRKENLLQEEILYETSQDLNSFANEIKLTAPEVLDHSIEISHEDMAHGCKKAIEELQKNANYGKEVSELVKNIGIDELINLMLAIAEQESGKNGKIGALGLHRYEAHLKTYSAGYFHILVGESTNYAGKNVKQSGQKALDNLNLTFHDLANSDPKTRALNNASLFLATLIEKKKEYKASDKVKKEGINYLSNRVMNFESFARFYNGSSWKKNNPLYVENCSEYYIRNKITQSSPNADISTATEVSQIILKQSFTEKNPDSQNTYVHAKLGDTFTVIEKNGEQILFVKRKSVLVEKPLPSINKKISSALNTAPDIAKNYIKKTDPNFEKTNKAIKAWMKHMLGRTEVWPNDTIEIRWSTKHNRAYIRMSGITPTRKIESGDIRLNWPRGTKKTPSNKIDTIQTNTSPKKISPEKLPSVPYTFVKIKKTTTPVSDSIQHANETNPSAKKVNNPQVFAQPIVNYIKTLTPPYALAGQDQIAIWKDEKGSHAIFKRGTTVKKFILRN